MDSAPTLPSPAATTLLLKTRRHLNEDPLDAPAVADLLHEALTRFATDYTRARSFEATQQGTLDRDLHLDQFFGAAPLWLAEKAATLLRKLNYLAHGSPYVPVDQSWDSERVRSEFVHAADEVAALLNHHHLGTPVPHFRGEHRLTARPGDLVKYELYDWGRWENHACTVVAVTPPYVLLRFRDRHIEEVDTTISFVYTVETGAVDLSDPIESRRTAFELLLFTDDLDTEDGRIGTLHYGPGRSLYTCPCCGYPSRRRRTPSFPRLLSPSYPTTPRCCLCGWADSPQDDHSDPDTWTGSDNGDITLAQARGNVLRHGDMFDSGAPDEATAPYREDGPRGAAVRRARSLLNVLTKEEDIGLRPTLWRAAFAALGLVAPEMMSEAQRPEYRDSRERINDAVRAAAGTL